MSPSNFQRCANRPKIKISCSNSPGDIVVGMPTSCLKFSSKCWETSELWASERNEALWEEDALRSVQLHNASQQHMPNLEKCHILLLFESFELDFRYDVGTTIANESCEFELHSSICVGMGHTSIFGKNIWPGMQIALYFSFCFFFFSPFYTVRAMQTSFLFLSLSFCKPLLFSSLSFFPHFARFAGSKQPFFSFFFFFFLFFSICTFFFFYTVWGIQTAFFSFFLYFLFTPNAGK